MLPAGPDSIGVATITHNGSRDVAIWSLNEGLEQSDLLVDEIGNYIGQVRWQRGSALIQVSTDGDWSIDLQ
ncbi:MAG: hypothetical protein RJQ01_02485 [Microcella sp.]|uniref:hypothetical protein n=1 Tax=Microcella sp. TaxID=1913979 RepID=UPI0033162277